MCVYVGWSSGLKYAVCVDIHISMQIILLQLDLLHFQWKMCMAASVVVVIAHFSYWFPLILEY